MALIPENRVIVIDPSESRTFWIELGANPTTGYEWHLSNIDTDLFEQLTHYYTGPSQPGLSGSGGKESWLFLLKRVLTDWKSRKLTFSYFRAWERNSTPARTIIYTIKFKGE